MCNNISALPQKLIAYLHEVGTNGMLKRVRSHISDMNLPPFFNDLEKLMYYCC
jgi:hypothetical protein